jgi:predicted amidophosphoribosyltransferase
MYSCGNCGVTVGANSTICTSCHASFSGVVAGSAAECIAKQQAWARNRAADAKRTKDKDRAYRASRKAADANAAAELKAELDRLVK